MLRRTALAVGALAVLCAGFLALGAWQVERRAWKHALIERVTTRVGAPAVDAPGLGEPVSAEGDEYRHVRLAGTWLADRGATVQAVTELGSGFWLMTPLRRADGSIVLVNRGFVASRVATACASAGPVEVTGLLRITEPGGGFLRHNDPAADRWFSRDVAAIAASRGLAGVAPYFVDAAATPGAAPTCPVGGLTVIAFHDSHAVYAMTWFALALLSAVGAWQVVRSGRQRDLVQDADMDAIHSRR